MCRDPISVSEWQQAVNAADMLLRIESARLYGLLATDVRPDVERCEDILRRGASAGIRPALLTAAHR